ncbi:MAG TPA: hypothetical protein VFC19_41665 [Candidatus Limnocylindrales bacterium]|nr:hypothetical protein [Candidatus Limnocylindrales bacterium]
MVPAAGQDCQIDTFGDKDFEPGFETHLSVGRVHELRVALFSDNADTNGVTLRLEVAKDGSRISGPSR